ncbi:MAG: thrombospondin type 3 repeat-containing protein, partial [Promethearchaeota archaeon]
MVKPGKATRKSINISTGIIFGFFVIFLVVFGIILSEFSISYQQSDPEAFPVFIMLRADSDGDGINDGAEDADG